MHSHSSWAEQCSSGSPSLSGERSRTPTPSRAPFSASFTEASDTPSRTDEAREEELPATEAEQQAFLPWHLSDAAPRDAGRIRHAPIVRKPVAVPAISHEPKQDAGDARGPTPHPSNAKELGQSSDLVVSSPVKSIWRIWALEMACLALSIIFFLVIVVVLWKFDGQKLPSWPLKITLNSFLSLFTTLAKAALLVPVSAAISHIQWSWFRGSTRPVYDFYLIDQASRGAWGSIALLWRFRFQHLVAFGALLVVISSVTSPVTQLAIDYPLRNDSTATAVTHITWDLQYPRDRLDDLADKAVYHAIYSDSTGFQQPLSYDKLAVGQDVLCPTGNCTFDGYQSLGVCAKVANITSHLHAEELKNVTTEEGLPFNFDLIPNQTVWRASLPGGYEVVHQSYLTMFTDILRGKHTFGFRNDPAQDARIVSYILINTAPILTNKTWWESASEKPIGGAMNDFKGTRHEATEVLFYLCVRSFETEVVMGFESTKITESSAELHPNSQNNPPFIDLDCENIRQKTPWYCQPAVNEWNKTLALRGRVNNSSGPAQKSSDGDVDIFTATHRSLEALAITSRTYLSGFVTVEKSMNYPVRTRSMSSYVLKRLFNSVLYDARSLKDAKVRSIITENIYQNVALSLSALFRSTQLDLRSSLEGMLNVTGEAHTVVAYVRISWPWLLLLASEIGLAMVFFGLAVLRGSPSEEAGQNDEPMFRDAKSSALATLVALSEDSRAALGNGLVPVDKIEQTAKGVKVRLEGGQLVLASESNKDEMSDCSTVRGD